MEASIRQRGFTLIELIVVVTILGILVAFAVPRVVALEGQARAASRDALIGSVRSAAALAHAMWLASGQPADVTMQDQVISLVFGYPDLATIDDALLEHAGFNYNPRTGVFSSTAVAACTVTYVPPAAANGAPTITASGADTC